MGRRGNDDAKGPLSYDVLQTINCKETNIAKLDHLVSFQ